MRIKQIGLLCGLSWVSTSLYYEFINRLVTERLGSQNSARMIMNSLNAEEVYSLFKLEKHHQLKKLLISEVKKLEDAGADFIGMACNTVHLYFDDIAEQIKVPMIHISHAVLEQLLHRKISKVGILGTRYTLQGDIYSHYLNPYNISVLSPSNSDTQKLNDMIYHFCSNSKDNSRLFDEIAKIINTFKQEGVEAIILGCTELSLLVNTHDHDVLFLDSASLHAKKLAVMAIRENLEQQKFANTPTYYLCNYNTKNCALP